MPRLYNYVVSVFSTSGHTDGYKSGQMILAHLYTAFNSVIESLNNENDQFISYKLIFYNKLFVLVNGSFMLKE